MDVLIKLNSQTAGRDKLIRLLQYLSRFLWHRLQNRGGKDVDRLRSLEYTFSTFRKCWLPINPIGVHRLLSLTPRTPIGSQPVNNVVLRLGRCVDTLYAVLPVINHPDVTVRVTVSMSKISNSLFLLADHMIWLSRSGVCELDVDKWGKLSNKYWLYSITMNLVRDVYEIYQIVQREQSVICPRLGCRTINDVLVSAGKAFMCVQSHRDIVIDTIKNSCDIFIPLTALGYTKFTPSTIGFLGVISSFAGILVLLDSKNKLTPS